MNAKTAKQIRRYTIGSSALKTFRPTYQANKRKWNAVPKHKKSTVRMILEETL